MEENSRGFGAARLTPRPSCARLKNSRRLWALPAHQSGKGTRMRRNHCTAGVIRRRRLGACHGFELLSIDEVKNLAAVKTFPLEQSFGDPHERLPHLKG